MRGATVRWCVAAGVGVAAGAWSTAEGAYTKGYDFPGYSLANPNGVDRPVGTLVQVGSVMYGMSLGGSNGEIFRYDPAANTATTVKALNSIQDGWLPHGSLMASGGILYGMTTFGGSGDGGSLFSYNVGTGAFTVLHRFAGGTSDGASPYGAVVLSGSTLYGMTSGGGSAGNGAVFQYNLANGAYSLVHSFAGGAADGAVPYGSLIVSGSVLYGMTSAGGASNSGTVFRVDAQTGATTLLHSFAGGSADGAEPHGSLLLSGTTLYGMTYRGGALGRGTIFSVDAMTGDESVLYGFKSIAAGVNPVDSLVKVGNSLYGMAKSGGAVAPPAYGGAVFQYDLGTGGVTSLHGFGTATDGNVAIGSLLVVGDQFYGMTEYGGTSDHGTVFTVSVPEPMGVAIGMGTLIVVEWRRGRRMVSRR